MTTVLLLSWPPRELHPNRASHNTHWPTTRARKAYRELIGWECKEQAPRVALAPPVSAQVTFLVGDRRHRDVDNLQAALKSAWDGMVAVGLLQGDSHRELRHLAPTVEYCKGANRVQVTLTEIEEVLK